MQRSQRGSDDFFRRAALEYYFGGDREHVHEPAEVQSVPVNVFETEGDIVITAPMPGVESENIDIQIHGSTLTLRATMRGPHQMDRRYLLHEWTYGPYSRTIELPMEVDAENANASHGNGILVLTLPKAVRARSVRIPLRQAGAQRAVHEGHAGHESGREGS